MNHTVYGKHANAKVLKPNQLVEIVINNYDGGPHPLHIHGHNVQLVARAPGVYKRHAHKNHNFLPQGIICSHANVTALGFTNSTRRYPAFPMRRDTWMAAASGYTVIRFRANNPGTWFIHCHMEWHMEAVSPTPRLLSMQNMRLRGSTPNIRIILLPAHFSQRKTKTNIRFFTNTLIYGLLLTLIEDPIALQSSQLTIPAGMQSVCKAAGIPLKGNAAGNTANYLNLTGQNMVPEYPNGALYP